MDKDKIWSGNNNSKDLNAFNYLPVLKYKVLLSSSMEVKIMWATDFKEHLIWIFLSLKFLPQN